MKHHVSLCADILDKVNVTHLYPMWFSCNREASENSKYSSIVEEGTLTNCE